MIQQAAFRMATLIAAAGVLGAQQPLPERIGPADDGVVVLNSLWSVRPAGRQVALDTFPMSSELSPDGRFLLVLHAGYGRPTLRVFDAETLAEVDRATLPDAWLGLSFVPGGRLVYVSGGASANIYEFGLSEEGELERQRTFSAVDRGESKTNQDFVGDIQVSPDGRMIYAAALLRNEVLVLNPQSGWVVDRFPAPGRPYRILFHPDGQSYFVTSMGAGSLYHFEASSGSQLYLRRLGPQPMDAVYRDGPLELDEGEEPPPWKARIFVAVANANRVQVLGVTEDKDLQELESINISTWPGQPLGMTPTALALSKDQSRLYIVCSNANLVAVADVSGPKSRLLGFIPTGWYPTDATVLDDGRLVVLNGKGAGSRANKGSGPNPLSGSVKPDLGQSAEGFVARLQKGSMSIIDAADERQLFQYTKQALRLSPYNDQRLAGFPEIPPGNPIPPRARVPDEMKSPIRQVLYIIKQNRTYDEILGDLGAGNGDPALAIFGGEVSPNHHKLARDFITFDNFFTSGDVRADGWFWSTAAIAPAFVERLWPAVYSGRLEGYDFQHYELAAMPPAGFLWNQAVQAGLTVRNYGLAVENLAAASAGGTQVAKVIDPALEPFTDRRFRGFDPDYPDTERAEVFIKDLARMEAANDMPRLMIMGLGNDRTSGTASGEIAPKPAVADNDQALGLIIEACSKSRFWERMAIFVVESDAAGGRDHVDAHRSVAFAISPYTRRGLVDSTMYNSASVLRTIELILGLSPMTQFDAASTPMWRAFAPEPDPRPWDSVKPKVPLTGRNP